MKKILLLAACMFAIVSCYDDSKLWESIEDHESRISKLEKLCTEMNSNISALQTIVTALQNNDYVTGVVPVTENGKTIGYTITFANAQPITVYHGKDAQDGVDGKDGVTPEIGVKPHTDGMYYWTLNGSWLLDDSGNMLPVMGKNGVDGTNGVDGVDGMNGITPQLKITYGYNGDGYWYVSYDEGNTWEFLGKATGKDGEDGKPGADGDSYFKSVTHDDEFVYFTLTDGTVIALPKQVSLSIAFEMDGLVVMAPNSTRDIKYTVTSALPDVEVEALASGDLEVMVIPDKTDNKTGLIRVKAPGDVIGEYSKVVVLVSNGEKVIMKTLKFEEERIEVLDEAQYVCSADGGVVELLYLANVECDIIVPIDAKSWISVVPQSKSLQQRSVHLSVAANEGTARETVISIQNSNGSMKLDYTISQEANHDYQLQLEREALIEFYEALDGDNWTRNDNWCSDKPISEWYGLVVSDDGYVWGIVLYQNNLSGEIPSVVGAFKNMRYLSLQYNNITGRIPDVFGEMPELYSLSLRNNKISAFPYEMNSLRHLMQLYLSGNDLNCEIPESIGELSKLQCLQLQNSGLYGEIPESIGDLTELRDLFLESNNLSGEIPASMGNLVNLERVNLLHNQLTGKIPESVMNLDCWPHYWAWMVNSGMSDDGLIIPAPKFTEQTIEGGTLDYSVYSENDYTVLYHYYDWCPTSARFTADLVTIYAGYEDKGLEVIAFSDQGTVESHKAYIEEYNTSWPYILLTAGSDGGSGKKYFNSYIGVSPLVDVVDKSGNVVFNHIFDDSCNNLADFLFERLGPPEEVEKPGHYVSTDYSADGTVNTLQTAAKGNGINIVLMGDGYSDRQIADGTYEADMKSLYDNLFTEEPYKSFQDCFSVHYVNVVSATEGYAYGDTALDGYFGDGTEVRGNDNAVFDYALNAISEDEMDEALLVVAMNSRAYAGTCYMYYPESATGTYGSGPAVAYFPKGGDEETLAQLLQHEANGHGFAKLADEYAYKDMGEVPGDYVSEIRAQQNSWGWWKNVDFISDLSAVRWNYFINDTRYANEGLGAYEGGLTYWSGVWRPTEDSIMRYNTGGFNAPSREAIYYRIHKLAYGDSWEYDYEDFVEYDAVNRSTSTSAPQRTRRNYVERLLEPTTPPVVVGKSWKDVR